MGLLVSAAVVAALLITGFVVQSGGGIDLVNRLALVTVVFLLAISALVFVACLELRGQDEDERTFRADTPLLVVASSPPEARAYAGGVFFLFGYGTKQKYVGPGQTRTCPNCSNTTQWERMRQFKQFTVFFIPIARWQRAQFEVCGICGAAVEV